ncbi:MULTISPECIES: hypothetical protein [unclassified Chryseobacterium]|uniref:hypothetical protein n=1 Tax=unclassified Chryseobacterium TaxID=2593645 RepID=UPI00285364B9|nr:hypothetical protein [Chryseobacterium sp. CFS7]MDR4892291.1 hypothetical protein [Chryseobacterium sp. CFS7]
MSPDEKHIRRINQYLRSINALYEDLVREIVLLVVGLKVGEKLFRFKDYGKITKGVSQAINKYNDGLVSQIKIFTQYEWDYGSQKVSDLLIENLNKIKDRIPTGAYESRITEISKQSVNKTALEAFQERKKGKFTISERVWNISKQARENLEFAIDDALREGISAQDLARKIKYNLNNPDALFRRVRDKHGNLVLSKNAAAFHPGQGVYRSAHKNALRLASNEINTAYREAEQLRIMSNNDVVGQRINLSPQHKVYDMCDDLQGNYPKDFKWSSWHVSCKCFRTMILKSEAEIINEINNGQDLSPEASKNFVAGAPDNFNQWIADNREMLERRRSKPYFLIENRNLIK